MPTFEFLGPQYAQTKISATGGISNNNTFKVRIRASTGEIVEWTGVVTGTQKTVTDSRIVKVLSTSPRWQEVV